MILEGTMESMECIEFIESMEKHGICNIPIDLTQIYRNLMEFLQEVFSDVKSYMY